MFGSRFFNARHWLARFWAATGASPVVTIDPRYSVAVLPSGRSARVLATDRGVSALTTVRDVRAF